MTLLKIKFCSFSMQQELWWKNIFAAFWKTRCVLYARACCMWKIMVFTCYRFLKEMGVQQPLRTLHQKMKWGFFKAPCLNITLFSLQSKLDFTKGQNGTSSPSTRQVASYFLQLILIKIFQFHMVSNVIIRIFFYPILEHK